MPKTTVWGYGAVTSASGKGLVNVHHAPSLTIESTWKRPVRIKWINDLVRDGQYLPHLLPGGFAGPLLGSVSQIRIYRAECALAVVRQLLPEISCDADLAHPSLLKRRWTAAGRW